MANNTYSPCSVVFEDVFECDTGEEMITLEGGIVVPPPPSFAPPDVPQPGKKSMLDNIKPNKVMKKTKTQRDLREMFKSNPKVCSRTFVHTDVWIYIRLHRRIFPDLQNCSMPTRSGASSHDTFPVMPELDYDADVESQFLFHPPGGYSPDWSSCRIFCYYFKHLHDQFSQSLLGTVTECIAWMDTHLMNSVGFFTCESLSLEYHV